MARSASRRKRDRSSSRSRSSSSRSYSSSSSSTSSSSPTSSSHSSGSRSSSSSSSTSSHSSRSSHVSRDADRRRSPSPICKVHVSRLTKNVNKNHLIEIFKTYGNVKHVDIPTDRHHPHLGKGTAFVEFEGPDQADKAIKFMDGGQIDGQEIVVARVFNNKPISRHRPSKNGSNWRKNSPRR